MRIAPSPASVCVLVFGLWTANTAHSQVNLQYVVPQNGSTAPDPSLIDARLDNGLGDTNQGFQTYDDFNDHFLNGTLFSSLIDGRTVLRRRTSANGGNNQAGIRTNGIMTTSAAFGSVAHGSNANTFGPAATTSLMASGYRASLKVWLADVPTTGTPIAFPTDGSPADQIPFNGASFQVTGSNSLGGFGLRTNLQGEMVLFPLVHYQSYSANPSHYEYVIPDLAPNNGTQNDLHIIDMIVPPGDNKVDFYVDGAAVSNMQNLLMDAPKFVADAVQFGDCCSIISDVEYAIEWLKVEGGVSLPHMSSNIPEPSTLLLTIAALAGLITHRRRRASNI